MVTNYIVHGGTLKGRIEGITCLQRAEELAFEYGAEVWEEIACEGCVWVKHRRVAIMRSI